MPELGDMIVNMMVGYRSDRGRSSFICNRYSFDGFLASEKGQPCLLFIRFNPFSTTMAKAM